MSCSRQSATIGTARRERWGAGGSGNHRETHREAGKGHL
jgi:hypothetical protein